MQKLLMWTVVAATLSCLTITGCASKTAKPDKKPKAQSKAKKVAKTDLEKVFQNIFEVPENSSIAPELLAPKTVEDAQNIVRSDNISLFPKADAVFAAHLVKQPDDLKNLTWHAQLYLAWSDSASLTQKTLGSSVSRLEKKKEKAEQILAAAEVDMAQQEQAKASIEELNWLIPMTNKVLAELAKVQQEKLAIGQEKTLAILEKHKDTYQGFRLGADMTRQTDEWDKYSDYITKLEQLNPDSNGLLFIRGVVAFSRDKDLQKAEKFLQQAVANDPKFTKAQYYLALTYLNRRKLEDADQAMAKTLEISPGHPFANAVQKYINRLQGM